MFRRERLAQIVSLLEHDGRVDTEELARRFGVSVDSIRKDLHHLSSEGKCTRVYGGAVRVDPSSADEPEDAPIQNESRSNVAYDDRIDPSIPTDPIGGSPTRVLAFDSIGSPLSVPSPEQIAEDEGRRRVALRAWMEINNGDSIFLDVSRTNSMLADIIATGSKRLIVTTNMLDVIRKVSNKPNITALGTGGYLNIQLNGFLGSATVSLLEPLLFSKAFIGTGGVNLDDGSVMTDSMDSGMVKEKVISNAFYKFLLVDEKKFHRRDSFRFGSLDDFTAVITDANDAEILSRLQRMGIPVLQALPPHSLK
ncbi:MAG: DeoR/GlpR family DNA-binding transcription regulator [Coriobacteriaceae bacterium]|uniref:DeoR/GlpR family DNA-binding transcription regulator n=1 Tax=Tractidigestivibacter sp. TaxID=2847320 RepID=UPI002A834DD4|nr:DeoR/GlpR family DNA-binding transcription regulator [Tractidigestivibacter sp.]MCI7438570.1 DeoR/GlpR family DNA-binding transcription regulator [Coriobacteriaceae bacterium]MDD7584515.1 DeoR/GlpR family DNA-binding transcription regulator [Coriobacteriaceae bacterium]MDY4533852.1 DeoR/GlpR family DNA-binding transcription regulator [Tractidigestivibacter sp.]